MVGQQECSIGVQLMAEQVQVAAAPKYVLPTRDTVVAANSSVTGNQQVQMVANALVQAAVDSFQAGFRRTGVLGWLHWFKNRVVQSAHQVDNLQPVANWLVAFHRFLLLPVCLCDHITLLFLFHCSIHCFQGLPT